MDAYVKNMLQSLRGIIPNEGHMVMFVLSWSALLKGNLENIKSKEDNHE